jgi:hypothetical protein
MESSDNNTPEEPGLRLQLTGKVALVFELEGYGPMTFNINDINDATNLLKQVLDMLGGESFTVNVYSDDEDETTISKILFKESI